MENPEAILQSLEEFSKLRPKDIPRELEEYLCFVAKTGDPVYQWASIKSLFREKLISVITEFYESCPSVEIPPCPNVDVFNYDIMKNFILEKLDTFAAAPFTVQRICELLTSPRKEYNRIDKYMRALEKNILVVSTTEPGNRRSTENGESIMNGIDSENGYDTNNSNNDINVEEMDDVPSWPTTNQTENTSFQSPEPSEPQTTQAEVVQETFVSESTINETACTSSADTVITKTNEPYVSIEPVASDTCTRQDTVESDVSVTITAIPAAVQKRRDSIEPVVSSEQTNQISESASSSTEKDPDIDPEKEEQSNTIESTLPEPSVNEESSITTSQTEETPVSCSEVSDALCTIECTSEETSVEAQPEPEVTSEDSPTISSEENFIIASSEETSTTDEITTSILENNESFPIASETKDNLISSSDEVENDNTTINNEVKMEEITETSNEAETSVDTPVEVISDSTTSSDNIEEAEPSVVKDLENITNTIDMCMEVDTDQHIPNKTEETAM